MHLQLALRFEAATTIAKPLVEWYLPRPDAIFPFALRQVRRLALALLHVVGQDLVGRIYLGLAVPDGFVPVGTLPCSTRAKASEPDREGLANHSVGQTLAARSKAGLCR